MAIEGAVRREGRTLTLSKIEKTQEVMEFSCATKKERTDKDSSLEEAACKKFRICPDSIRVTTNVTGQTHVAPPLPYLFLVRNRHIRESDCEGTTMRVGVIKMDINHGRWPWHCPGTLRPLDTTNARMGRGRLEETLSIFPGKTVQITMEKFTKMERSIALLESKRRTGDICTNTKPIGKTLKKCRFSGADLTTETNGKGESVESPRKRLPCRNSTFRTRKPNFHCLIH